MVIQTRLHGNGNFPFCVNGFCSGGLEEFLSGEQQQEFLFGEQQQQQPQPDHLPRQVYNERQGHADLNLSVGDSNAALNSPNLAVQFEKQWEEIDQFIKFQNEELRKMIQQKEKQQVTALLKNAESRTHHILMKKDEELAQAVQKRRELEEFIKGLEAQNREWKRLAREKEATILSLCRALKEEEEKRQRMMISDAESCNIGENQAENNMVFEQKEVCKGCYSRRSCVLFLPCRHLATCKTCEAYLQACPICGMLKKAGIETLFF